MDYMLPQPTVQPSQIVPVQTPTRPAPTTPAPRNKNDKNARHVVKTNITSRPINAAYFILGVSSFVVAYYAGNIDAAWIAILAFVGAGIMFGLSVRRFTRYTSAVSTNRLAGTISFMLTGDLSLFNAFIDPSTIDTNHAVNKFPTWSIVMFAVIAAFAGWGVLEMNHGALRTMLGFVGGLATYETMMPVVIKFAPNV